MIDGPSPSKFSRDPSLSLRLIGLRAMKAGACEIELMPPPLGGGREQTGQES